MYKPCRKRITNNSSSFFSTQCLKPRLAAFSIRGTMSSGTINYNIQAVAVRLSLGAGETGGIEMFLPDNPHSVFSALANSYIYMSLSMFFAGFLFKTGRLEKWIRGWLLAQIITAVGQTAYSMFDARKPAYPLT